MKFGGTSVEDAAAIDRVATIVKSRLAEQPFVVVSAMAKVTDQLLAMAAAASWSERFASSTEKPISAERRRARVRDSRMPERSSCQAMPGIRRSSPVEMRSRSSATAECS